MFTRLQGRMPHIEQGFRSCIDKKAISKNSMLCWASLNGQTQRLRISSDDAKIAKDITNDLMLARDNQDWDTIEQIENEFCPLYRASRPFGVLLGVVSLKVKRLAIRCALE